MNLQAGQVAVVTGAGSGIGRALAVAFAGEGMKVVLADIEEAPLVDAATAVTAAGAEALSVVTDVGDDEAVERLAEEAYGAFGAVHVLCNNAGVFTGGLVWECTKKDFAWAIRVNLFGILNGVRAFIPRMIEGGHEGHVVNTASSSGLIARPFSAPYTVSKFAAVAASECLAHDLKTSGSPIGVSVLCPGLVRTKIGRSGRNRPSFLDSPQTATAELVERLLQGQAEADGQSPETVANVVVDGIRRSEFLIAPRPVDHLLRDRTDALISHDLPPAVFSAN